MFEIVMFYWVIMITWWLLLCLVVVVSSPLWLVLVYVLYNLLGDMIIAILCRYVLSMSLVRVSPTAPPLTT